MIDTATEKPSVLLRMDKLGAFLALLAAVGLALPFATFSANRIVLGEPNGLWQSLPRLDALFLVAMILTAALLSVFRSPNAIRLIPSSIALLALLICIGRAGTILTPEGDSIARVSPASGFWVLLFTLTLLVTDTLTRIGVTPLRRVMGVGGIAAVLGVLLVTGVWDDLSIMKEYESRASSFWREGRRHIALAFASLGLATMVGIPLGVFCHRSPRLRVALLNVLNIIQTIPSIALFGLLIAPLAWVATNVPGAAALGISGIGAAPALVALFAYSLLPVVSNTVVGLDGVPHQARDAALGMGMTDRQTLVQIEAPLALPVILTGIRIVLVQNIGLATIAGLIGGGGFGVFVFQGMGQTAADLILLGALPTVLLAFASANLVDAVIELADASGATGVSND